jgi:hypothetical protein
MLRAIDDTDVAGLQERRPMPDTPPARRRGSWRHRENRASPKYIAKRVSQEEHELITAYAKNLNVTVAELLGPAVSDLISRARAHKASTIS